MSFTLADMIGSAGVALLLLAFALNLSGYLRRDGAIYAAMNVVGAGLAAAASVMINYIPFVILESVWCIVSIAALTKALVRD